MRRRGVGAGVALLPGGFWPAFFVLLLAIAMYYASCAAGLLGPEWSPSKLLAGLKDPYDFPDAPQAG